MDSKLVQEVQTRYILHWNYRGLSILPEELLNYGGHVEDIYLKENGLIELPDNLHEKLKHLAQLYLYGNRLERLPETFGKVQTLQILDLCKNSLISLPDSIGDLINLVTLDVSHNCLKDLPSSIGQLKKLEVLIAVKNNLTQLPMTIKGLASLKSLHLNGNKLTAMPTELCQCQNLTDLYLEGNRLTCLPDELTMLPKLSHVNLIRNQLQVLPILPFLSNAKVFFEDNPAINEIPYIFGCQQNSIKSQMFRPLIEDSHLWNIRTGGCFQIASKARKNMHILHKSPPSLLEQSFSSLYLLCYSRQVEQNTSFKRFPRKATLYGKKLCNEQSFLPKFLFKKLKQGPKTFCCQCLKPIFFEGYCQKMKAPISEHDYKLEPVSAAYFCTEVCAHKMFE